MASSSPPLIAPSSINVKSLTSIRFSRPTPPSIATSKIQSPISTTQKPFNRRDFLSLSLVAAGAGIISLPAAPAIASSTDEYVKETKEVIEKVRSTISLEKGDPNVADAVAGLRETSNYWVSKYRKEKDLLGKPSFRDMYSALNAVSGHYISFGPTAPIPAKRRARILEEMETAEKALVRGR
ncbi:photosystem II repair protein PSB27-H1, chloroplastic-like [Impatiens glandulifera]|uniref:photosystem II repair protein PSB27-H1, chloroplastic-like n=1 Tax=Impatiens glandulifera TaxID=253017 RepID=UPI001FB10D9E|nr:photosystem II repair protein PSB27-H1, chloroplastic-like [Impatiens glandulifera]